MVVYLLEFIKDILLLSTFLPHLIENKKNLMSTDNGGWMFVSFHPNRNVNKKKYGKI